MKKRVLVAMSGGVDSAVAALLLSEQGYEVIGAHMKLWDYVDVGGDIHRDGRCCTLDSVTDCRFVCDSIGAPFYVLNLSAHFKKEVIDNFVAEYSAGRTPNPCVRCNSEVKWDEFLTKATGLGCDFIATGHYAYVEQNDQGRWQIRKGVDGTRDQSYVLWGLTQEALARTLMPLGGLLKSEVRSIARRYGLKTAEKAESREICFVADNDYRRFIREYEDRRGRSIVGGEIVTEDGEVVGSHAGTVNYTIGQRKGLGISARTPLYVQRIDVERNRVVVGESDSLFSSEAMVENLNWHAFETPPEELEAEVKIRYLSTPVRAIVTTAGSGTAIRFHEPQRAVTPGQTIVFYERDVLLGGGLIAKATSASRI